MLALLDQARSGRRITLHQGDVLAPPGFGGTRLRRGGRLLRAPSHARRTCLHGLDGTAASARRRARAARAECVQPALLPADRGLTRHDLGRRPRRGADESGLPPPRPGGRRPRSCPDRALRLLPAGDHEPPAGSEARASPGASSASGAIAPVPAGWGSHPATFYGRALPRPDPRALQAAPSLRPPRRLRPRVRGQQPLLRGRAARLPEARRRGQGLRGRIRGPGLRDLDRRDLAAHRRARGDDPRGDPQAAEGLRPRPARHRHLGDADEVRHARPQGREGRQPRQARRLGGRGRAGRPGRGRAFSRAPSRATARSGRSRRSTSTARPSPAPRSRPAAGS